MLKTHPRCPFICVHKSMSKLPGWLTHKNFTMGGSLWLHTNCLMCSTCVSYILTKVLHHFKHWEHIAKMGMKSKRKEIRICSSFSLPFWEFFNTLTVPMQAKHTQFYMLCSVCLTINFSPASTVYIPTVFFFPNAKWFGFSTTGLLPLCKSWIKSW